MADETILNFGGRTPLPDDSVKFQVVVPQNEADYIRSVIDARPGLSLTYAINSEFDFLRTWGLTATMLPRLVEAAKQKHVAPIDYVQMLVARYVATLPPSSRPPEGLESSSSTKVKLSFNITGPNYALMLAHGKQRNFAELTVVFRDLMKFARFYGLDPLQFVVLRDFAASKGAGARDLVVDLLIDVVRTLPEVESPKKGRSRRA